MTVLDRPELKQPMQRVELPIRQEPPEAPVRWIAWTVSIVILGVGALVALFMMRGGDAEPFEDIYEAQSPLSYGAVHTPGFTVEPRWAGESDLTLEEFEMLSAYETSVGEADTVFTNQATERLAALEASTGEADRVLLNHIGGIGPFVFTPAELAALQASIGSADQKYLNMARIG